MSSLDIVYIILITIIKRGHGFCFHIFWLNHILFNLINSNFGAAIIRLVCQLRRNATDKVFNSLIDIIIFYR